MSARAWCTWVAGRGGPEVPESQTTSRSEVVTGAAQDRAPQSSDRRRRCVCDVGLRSDPAPGQHGPVDGGSGTENGSRHGITEPAHRGDEATALLGFLQRQRQLVAWKVTGASEAALRSVSTDSGLGPHGLVRHLTNVERSWLRDVFDGQEGLAFDWTEDDPDGELHVHPDVTMEQLLAEYHAETSHCDEVVLAHHLDDVSAHRGFSLRWILLHLLEETARHLGHLDLLRELADGSTGEEPAG